MLKLTEIATMKREILRATILNIKIQITFNSTSENACKTVYLRQY